MSCEEKGRVYLKAISCILLFIIAFFPLFALISLIISCGYRVVECLSNFLGGVFVGSFVEIILLRLVIYIEEKIEVKK